MWIWKQLLEKRKILETFRKIRKREINTNSLLFMIELEEVLAHFIFTLPLYDSSLTPWVSLLCTHIYYSSPLPLLVLNNTFKHLNKIWEWLLPFSVSMEMCGRNVLCLIFFPLTKQQTSVRVPLNRLADSQNSLPIACVNNSFHRLINKLLFCQVARSFYLPLENKYADRKKRKKLHIHCTMRRFVEAFKCP